MTARAASLRGHVRGAASRRTVQRVVCAQPRAVAGAVRSRCRHGVLQPAHRPPPSDRLLRRPPAGLQLQHTRQARARRPQHRRQHSKRCSRAGIDPSEDQAGTKRRTSVAVARHGAAICCGSRSPRARGARARATSIVRVIRCCTERRRRSPSSSTRRCTRRRCSTCGTVCPSIRSVVLRAISLCVDGRVPAQEWIEIPAGRVTLGAR